MSDPRITDEAVTAVALALADEVRKWPMESSVPHDARVGVGATFQELARSALEAALPHLTPQPTRYEDSDIDMIAWPSGLSADNPNLTPAAPQPVVDRAAIEHIIAVTVLHYDSADAVLMVDDSDLRSMIKGTDALMALINGTTP